ncbi:MAG: single-stranded-DNA-specific exonuclease RecJ [Kamptonema sp. SIO1D9]|nr:single-stranded-DNA-specific exonuclease RecJ [Kamptonema sp. SIO1D9]
MIDRLPAQRWQIAPTAKEKVDLFIQTTGLDPLIARVIVNRGIDTPQEAYTYLDPEVEQLPSPLDDFPDLAKSVELLTEARSFGEKVAICGDYDADGMTSTALLLRAFAHLGIDVDYAIPSRMKDGYGINQRIVEEFAESGVGLILTVDNGISAYEAIARAIELGLTVIITDHHDIPEKLPPADAILNPKLIRPNSPYRSLAGVGVAYILAVTTAQSLGLLKGLTNQLLELFTLGTIADLAPLVGVNRRWLKRGLRILPKSEIRGIQALIQVAGVSESQKALKPDDIGFKLGPRINAVGRIGDPQIAIELLTTTDEGIALERAMQCEQLNHQRQQLCEQIEHEAISAIEQFQQASPQPALYRKTNAPDLITAPTETHFYDYLQARVLVIVQPNWHHGVIGIVASRLVERYGVPVFIGTYEDEEKTHIRGSARGIREFNVFQGLEYCDDLLGKYGGHHAAGGFSLSAANLVAFQQRLSEFAYQCLEREHLKPLVEIDGEANFSQLTPSFYQQIDSLQPWGIANNFPIFWTPNVRVLEQRIVGKNHLKLVLGQDTPHGTRKMSAIAWRWGAYFPLPNRLDIAYKLQENHFQGNTNIELQLVGVRLPANATLPSKKAKFDYQGNSYLCNLVEPENELRIRNSRGEVLAIRQGETVGLRGKTRDDAVPVDVSKPIYSNLIQAAIAALDTVTS